MSDSPAEQKEKAPSRLTHMTARTAEGLNWLTYHGNGLAAWLFAGIGVIYGLGGALLQGGAFLVGAVVQNLLSRDARRAHYDSAGDREEGLMTGPLSAKYLAGGLARAVFTPVLVGFNLLATIPFVDVGVANRPPHTQPQTIPNGSKAQGKKSLLISVSASTPQSVSLKL